MLLIYGQEAPGPLPPEEDRAVRAGHRAVVDDAIARGVFRAAEPLHPVATATTVRRQGGRLLIGDGPFAETREQLAGYYILECRDLDEALEWAARIPAAGAGLSGCVEVRPIGATPRPLHANCE
ncbi:MAG: YciI family protein [Streptosporangiaceae bacterium]